MHNRSLATTVCTPDQLLPLSSKQAFQLAQEQKKKELEELNAMLAEMGVAPKESDGENATTAPAGKKKKKKDKAAVKDTNTPVVNGNGVAPEEQPRAEEPASEQPQQESIEVTLKGICKVPISQPSHAIVCLQ